MTLVLLVNIEARTIFAGLYPHLILALLVRKDLFLETVPPILLHPVLQVNLENKILASLHPQLIPVLLVKKGGMTTDA
jgi:hypothetical protein